MNTQEKGNIGLGEAINYFCKNNYTVSIPLNDTQKYDLVVERKNKLYTVQVKYTTYKDKNKYQVSLRSCGGTNGSVYSRIIDTKVDYLFVVTKDNDQYFIPIKNITSKSTINLCNKYKEYKAN